jgi:hypothetical protein
MTYASYLAKLRTQVGDNKRLVHVSWTGDGATLTFPMPTDTYPVLESTYVIKIDGSTQTETTHYTLDRETGVLAFVSAPGNATLVTIDCYAVYLQDATWIQIINDTISSLGDDFFKEFVDTALTTTANMLTLSLVSGQPNCIAVYEFNYRDASTSDYEPVENFANWRYDRDNNIIYIGGRESFPITGKSLKIRGLKTYTLGLLTSSTVDVQDKFMTIVDYGTIARYYQQRYKSVIELVSKMTMESTRTPLQELIMISDRFQRQYEQEKMKLKPAKPARQIPVLLEGCPRP